MMDASSGSRAIGPVLGALERLVADLRERTEQAERRAAAAEERAALDREAREAEAAARQEAEFRAAAAEARAHAAETAAGGQTEELLREILAASRVAAEAAGDAAAAIRRDRTRPGIATAPERADRPEGREPWPPAEREWEEEATPRRTSSRRRREGGGYAWMEDEPGPSWWRRLFRWR